MTTLSTLEILQIYKSNVLLFLDSLTELLKNDEADLSDVIIVRILFENQIPIEESMKKLSIKLLSPIESKNGIIHLSDMIRSHNDKFFIDYTALIFSGLNEEKMIRWKHLWTSKRLDAEDKNSIWKWMELFLNLAEMYATNENMNVR